MRGIACSARSGGVTNTIIPLRVTEEQTESGLNVSQHGKSLDQVRAAELRPSILDVA